MIDINVFCHKEQYWSMSSEASASQSVSEFISEAFSKSACIYLQTVHLCWLGYSVDDGATADSKVITPMIRVRKRRDGGTIKYLGWRRG